MRLSICLGLCLSVCFVNTARAEDEPTKKLRVDRCPKETATTETETPEERDTRKVKLAGAAYDLGLGLYEEGDYHGAINAFVDSYCNKAHPASFFNIAQSYERLLDFQRAVDYFKRYVKEADASDPNAKRATLRAEVLGNLPAQLKIATVPAGASITIRNDAGVIARGKANGTLPIEVRQGKYAMHVEMPGFESIEQSLVTKPGQPYSYYLRLEPEKTTLQVTVNPANARIFVDKRLVGAGSYSELLPIGSYEISAEAPKRVTSTRVVQLSTGKPNSQVIDLEAPKVSGRTELLIASGLGLGATGAVAVSSIFDQDTVITVGAALATTAVGFGGAYYGIPDNVARGDAWYLIESTLIGFTEGAIVGSFFACEEKTGVDMQREEDCTDGVKAGAAITGGMLGALTATATRSRFKLTTGDAALIGSGGMWGLLTGAFFYAIFDSEYRLRDPMFFTGLNLGLVASTGLVANSDVSLRRIAIIDVAGMGGLVGGIGLSRALASRDDQVQHYALLGLITGLVGGTFLTRSMDDEPQGYSLDDSITLLPGVSTTRDAEGNSVMSVGVSSAF